MSVEDTIKKSVLESDMFNQAITAGTILTIIIDMLVALALGMLIYYIYRKFFIGVIFSKSFAATLVGMTVLTCMVTLAISTNIVISLGMVGALSIVRYRTAVKEPMDLLYLFWAITVGITVGASMYILSLIGSAIVIGMIALLVGKKQHERAYVMIVHYSDDEAGDEIIRTISNMKYTIKSKTLRNMETEMSVQVVCKNDDLSFAEKVRAIEKVNDLTIVQYNGEYHG